MSHLEKNLPHPEDRLNMLLDHATAMVMALTCEDFDEINEQSKRSYYDALLHVVIDASDTFDEFVKGLQK